jgi:hypothetical protein
MFTAGMDAALLGDAVLLGDAAAPEAVHAIEDAGKIALLDPNCHPVRMSINCNCHGTFKSFLDAIRGGGGYRDNRDRGHERGYPTWPQVTIDLNLKNSLRNGSIGFMRLSSSHRSCRRGRYSDPLLHCLQNV